MAPFFNALTRCVFQFRLKLLNAILKAVLSTSEAQVNQNIHCHLTHVKYCRFGNFRENFIFANSIKRHISDVKNSRIRQDLPLSINDRVILPFREGFIFTKLRICEVSRKLSPRENFRIYSTPNSFPRGFYPRCKS